MTDSAIGEAAGDIAGGLLTALDLAEVAVRRLDGTILHWSGGMAALYGWTAADAVGRVSHDLLRTRFPVPLAEIEAEMREAGCWTGELVHAARDGRRLVVLSRWRLHRGASAGEAVVVEASTDMTALRAGECALVASEARTARADEDRASGALVARELGHRFKNALATVAAVADQTLRRADDDPARFVRDFTGRLGALGRAHELLGERVWQGGADLAAVLRAALAPWSSGAIDLAPAPGAAGPRLGARQAQALVLGLHELATNAAKHGALSRPGGRVAVAWAADADGTATVAWAEAGGPAVVVPERRGFGSDLLRRALPRELGAGATVSLAFEPAGVRACLRFVPRP